MSIVEQSVDCLKNEERIKDISSPRPGDAIKVISKEMTVEMDVDAVEMDKSEQTEQQTNGSASKLKEKQAEESNENKESKTKCSSAESDVNSESDGAVEKMDVDAPANGNGIKEDENGDMAEIAATKNTKETDETEVDSGEGKKTGSEAASGDNKDDESNETIDKEAKGDEKKETDEKEKVVDESKVENNDAKKAESSADAEVSVADVEMSEKEKSVEDKKSAEDKKSETETIQSKIEEKKNNNESSENTDPNMETNADTPTRKETSDEVENNSATDVEHKNENTDIQAETNGNDIKESSETDNSSTKNSEDTSADCKTDEVNANIENEVAKESTKPVKDEEMTEVNDENEPTETKDIAESSNKAKEDEQKNDEKIEQAEPSPIAVEKPLKEVLGNEANENSSEKDNGDDRKTNAENNSSPSSEQASDKDSKDDIKEDPPSSKDDDMIEPASGKSVSAKSQLAEEGEDQEMSELPAETESKAKEDEDIQAVDEEPANETMYVDENRYFESGNMVELSRITWKSQCDKQQYVRGCLWSPDGTCILAAVNMDGMHVINLGTDLYTTEFVSPNRPVDKLESVINVKEGGTVYDYCWYPFMNSALPETCCWLSSRQHCPIQLWDGYNGDLRGSYRGYDNVDEIEAAFSVTFTSDAEKIIGGYKKTLKIFDTKSPGREYSVIPIKQPCSCFAVQETQSNIIATGSWNCAVNLYDLRAPKLGTLVTLEEHSGGVTFLKFAASGDSLFSGARKDNKLLEWDMRNFSKPIRQLNRTVNTNQRVYFDLSPGEKWLASGDTGGLIHVWDLKSKKDGEEFAFELHRDCCNGVSFHPSRSMLATCSGQYHFLDDIEMCGTKAARNEVYENSLIFWWVGGMSESDDKDDDKPEPMAAEENGGDVQETDEKMES